MSDKHTAAQGDERARFEEAYRNEVGKIKIDGVSEPDFSRNGMGHYINLHISSCWSGYKIRASEGQAQTSAALPNIAGEPGFELLLEGYREFGDKGNRKSNLLGFIHAWYKHHAAQLADSTAPGAHPLDALLTDREKELHKVIGSLQAKLIAMQVNRNEWKKIAETQGDLHAESIAAPTAQQSLTVGGAVPDERAAFEKAMSNMGQAAGYEGDGYYKYSSVRLAYDAWMARAALAAAPLPQVQSEALDEVISLEELAALLPGPYYMDPPDGGSVHVMEQLRRMSEDAAKFRACANWQSINTAPKDGSEILLRSARGRIASGKFGQPDGWANPLCWIWPYVNIEPAHWKPLPPEPTHDAAQHAIKPSVDNDRGVA